MNYPRQPLSLALTEEIFPGVIIAAVRVAHIWETTTMSITANSHISITDRLWSRNNTEIGVCKHLPPPRKRDSDNRARDSSGDHRSDCSASKCGRKGARTAPFFSGGAPGPEVRIEMGRTPHISENVPGSEGPAEESWGHCWRKRWRGSGEVVVWVDEVGAHAGTALVCVGDAYSRTLEVKGIHLNLIITFLGRRVKLLFPH
jgi:hypothetical protein